MECESPVLLLEKNKSAGFLLCARRAHVLTGESPESARQWEGYSRTARVSP